MGWPELQIADAGAPLVQSHSGRHLPDSLSNLKPDWTPSNLTPELWTHAISCTHGYAIRIVREPHVVTSTRMRGTGHVLRNTCVVYCM